jgi:hypothetical protein
MSLLFEAVILFFLFGSLYHNRHFVKIRNSAIKKTKLIFSQKCISRMYYLIILINKASYCSRVLTAQPTDRQLPQTKRSRRLRKINLNSIYHVRFEVFTAVTVGKESSGM